MKSIEEVKESIMRLSDFHEAMVRNGWRVPAPKSKLCTRQFLMEVKQGTTWCLRYDQMTTRGCPKPPATDVICAAILETIQSNVDGITDPALKMRFLNFYEHLSKREGDRSFMLDVLATLSQGKHPIFSKEYVPPQKPSQQKFTLDIDNTDGFFTGLPPSKFKGRATTASILMTPEQRLMQKTRKLEARLQKVRDQLE
jgi:hypothetical protein